MTRYKLPGALGKVVPAKLPPPPPPPPPKPEWLNAELDTIRRLTASVPEADQHELASEKVRAALFAITGRNNALRAELDCARESYSRVNAELAEAWQEAEQLRELRDAARAFIDEFRVNGVESHVAPIAALILAVDALSTPEPEKAEDAQP